MHAKKPTGLATSKRNSSSPHKMQRFKPNDLQQRRFRYMQSSNIISIDLFELHPQDAFGMKLICFIPFHTHKFALIKKCVLLSFSPNWQFLRERAISGRKRPITMK